MSDDKFTLSILLKQHTPLIHFQPDQAGATLRATEVKPKLDRFIIQKHFKGKVTDYLPYLSGYSAGKRNEMERRVKGEEKYAALNYSIVIEASQVWTRQIESFPGFFGNMGRGGTSQSKQFSFCSEPILVRIFSFNVQLLAIVKAQISAFFHVENFGTRQTKGFGSFQVETINQEVERHAPLSNYYFDLPVALTQKDFSDPERVYIQQLRLFKSIDLFYRSIRSGINLKGRERSDKLYFKSLMFQYAKSHNAQWDKRTIRDHFFKTHPEYRKMHERRSDPTGTVQYTNPNRSKLFRDTLGLSSQQSWLTYRAELTKTDPSGRIDRYASPLLFKPIHLNDHQFRVYIIPRTIPEGVLGATLEISDASTRGPLRLTIPHDFNVAKYLDFVCQYFSDNASFDEYIIGDTALDEVKTLRTIYQQLIRRVNG